MLKELKIEGFKLLRDVRIRPHEGFNVITGETGAGKSLLLGALKFLLGAKGGDELFSKGETSVKVLASFELPKLSPAKQHLVEEGIIEPDENEVHIERWKERDGRSRFFIGGRRANLPVIIEFQNAMVDFLEQHQVSRIVEHTGIEVLDRLGDKEHKSKVETVRTSYVKWSELSKELSEKERKIRELSERRELIQFQLKELKDADLVPNELDELNREHKLLASAMELRANAEEARILLGGDEGDVPGAGDSVSRAAGMLEPLATIDYDWASKLEELRNVEGILRETVRELVSMIDNLNDDPDRLAQVEQRIAIVEKLKRKYHLDHAGLIALRDQLEGDIETISAGDEDLENLRKELAMALDDWHKEAQELSTSRKKLAKRIEKELKNHLSDLDLTRSRVAFSFEEIKEGIPSSKGIDKVEILLATNPAEELRPLASIASGGEATRIALALKALWADREGVPILVLDESDIGIGGETAHKVASKFKEIAKSHQLIVVSHLAQVAAIADRHFRIEKIESAKNAGISIDELSGLEREKELARMLGGSRDPESSIALAKSLLSTRDKKWGQSQLDKS